ncbi:hypothetical protein AVEN_83189-1 [Araneus ventricosus]|uniref:Uncharacterized protein n=1 Tax=Araneus ventricosus TaxID=182803 RepID=A0A4Y2AMT7_ARAVE|nr:hypothetical protein AVEN_83189-1 [Araneus ventricosus]
MLRWPSVYLCITEENKAMGKECAIDFGGTSTFRDRHFFLARCVLSEYLDACGTGVIRRATEREPDMRAHAHYRRLPVGVVIGLIVAIRLVKDIFDLIDIAGKDVGHSLARFLKFMQERKESMQIDQFMILLSKNI